MWSLMPTFLYQGTMGTNGEGNCLQSLRSRLLKQARMSKIKELIEHFANLYPYLCTIACPSHSHRSRSHALPLSRKGAAASAHIRKGPGCLRHIPLWPHVHEMGARGGGERREGRCGRRDALQGGHGGIRAHGVSPHGEERPALYEVKTGIPSGIL